MSTSLVLYSAVLLIGTLISSISQALLKIAATKKYDSRIAEYLNVRVIIAYALFFIATILCIISYKIVPLSMGPVLESTSYIYITIFGIMLFGEKLNKTKVLALILIVAGIVLSAAGA